MKNQKTKMLLLSLTIFLTLIGVNGCQSIKTFTKKPEQYQGDNHFTWQSPDFDASKKNVFIVANTRLTELFDMIAPFYLFNNTGKANVYIVADRKSPIQIKDKLYVLPQITFNEVDSLKLHADVIVIPFLGVIDTNQNPVIVNWIKNHYTETTKILSICDGAATAAATGLYDGKPLTCHASDYAIVTPNFPKPLWIQQVSVTHSGNLYSTAGVSNAVEGSLMVIDDLFGREIMQSVMSNIHYKYPEIKLDHNSIAVNGKAKVTIIKKILFRNNRKVGVLLQDGANEFQLASILDTYSRTFPARFEAYRLNGNTVKTKYGLTLVSTLQNKHSTLNELHVLDPASSSKEELTSWGKANVISYSGSHSKYPIDECVKRIATQYGDKFANVTKLMLDYN
jgi:transcriptional regulator GlxA family with amidase domain